MTLTTTSIAFILLGIGLGFCGWRFFRAFQEKGGLKSASKVGFFLSLFLFGFAIQTGIILGFGTWLLSGSSDGLFTVFIIANAFLTFLAMLGIYTSYYIFLPHKSPWLFIIITLIIGIIVTLLAIVENPQPFISESGGVEWNISFPVSLLTFYLLLIGIGVHLYIFGRLFLIARMREVKILSFFLSIFAIAGITDQFIRFILLHSADTDLRTQIYDIGIALIGIGLIITLVIIPLIRIWISRRREKRNFRKNF